MPEGVQSPQEGLQGEAAAQENLLQSMMTPEGDEAARAEDGRRRRANALLLGAIASSDASVFDQAARAGADVNFDNGQPLRLAAQNNNQLMLRLLVTRGADIAHAKAALKDEQSGIQRKQKYRDPYYETGVYYTYKNKDEERRWKQANASLKVLEEYEKVYLEKIAPLEAVRLQQQTLDEMRALREEITTALHGRKLPKPRLSAPDGKGRMP